MEKEYSAHSDMQFPKAHDPVHDSEVVELFGSHLNLDEMNMEACHQTSKRQAKLTNKHSIEIDLLSKASK